MNIEILVKPKESTIPIERVIQTAASALKIKVQVVRTNNFEAYSHLAINPTLTPIVIIDGKVEFAGKAPNVAFFTKRLAEIFRS